MKIHTRLSFVSLLLVLALLPINTYAIDRNLTHTPENSLSISFMNFSYKEVNDSNDFLDREDGLLPGIIFRWDRPAGSLQMTGEISLYKDGVTYDGQTQSGTPVSSKTDTYITDISLTFAQLLKDKNLTLQSLYFGLGYRYWDRDIRNTRTGSGVPVLGLHEIYVLPYIMLGTRWNLVRSKNVDSFINLRLTQTVNPQMFVDLYDGVTLDLGAKFGYRLSTIIASKSGNTNNFYMEPFYEFWEIGKSNTKYLSGVGYIYEPKSITNNLGLNIGFQW